MFYFKEAGFTTSPRRNSLSLHKVEKAGCELPPRDLRIGSSHLLLLPAIFCCSLSHFSGSAVKGSPLPNTGKHAFTPPGNNGNGDGDWVLVFETTPPMEEAGR